MCPTRPYYTLQEAILLHESVLVKPCIMDFPTEIEPSHVQPGTYMSIGIVFPT